MTQLDAALQSAANLARGGRLREAEAACRDILTRAPQAAGAHALLGQLLMRLSRPAEAREHLELVARSAPAAPIFILYAQCLASLGDTRNAVGALEAAAAREPASWQTQMQVALSLAQLKHPGAAPAFERALPLLPADARVLEQVANSLRAAGEYRPGVRVMRRITELQPGNPDAWLALGGGLFYLRDFDASEAATRRAIEIAPTRAPAHSALCRVLERTNRLAEARDAGLRAVEQARGAEAAQASWELARVERRLGHLESARDRLLACLNAPGVSADMLASMHVELGLTLDGLKDYARAYHHFSTGQAQWLELPRTRIHAPERFPERLRAYEAVDWKAHAPRWPASRPASRREARQAPVFFVGFPRSGTTLLETMLAAHPRFAPTDEEPVLTTDVINPLRRRMTPGASFPEYFCALPDSAMDDAEAGYWAGMERELGPERLAGRRLLDKLPLNICFLPVIRRVFPDARVLVALRDPRDVCLSCLFQEFRPNDAMVHFGKLETAAALYAQVMGLYRRYRNELGLSIMESRYEDLVAEPEARLRAILDFLGEPWDDAILSVVRGTQSRDVKTPSYRGIGQGVYTRSVKRWMNYREPLTPLLPMLEPFVQAFGYDPSGGA
ncbi:MAG: sulfotransferase [Phycisphaerales bacterium]|nr:sulfotransferase [Phycisphaerales bacterium]